MMNKVDLNLCFKGERQYIHGTDMLDKSIELLEQHFNARITNLDFIIHRRCHSNLCMWLYPLSKAPELIGQDTAAIKFDAAGQCWEARLKETGIEPNCHNPYDEDSIIGLCRINNTERSIRLQGKLSYSAIETLVAMTKALHLNVYPELDASWMFCRLQCPHWPLEVELNGVSIQLLQALGTRLTMSEIILGGEILGKIYFCTGNGQ